MVSHNHPRFADPSYQPCPMPQDNGCSYDPAIEEQWEFAQYTVQGTSDLTRIVLEGYGQMRMFGGAA